MTDHGPGIVVPLPFPESVRGALQATQLRRNTGKASTTLRAQRRQVVSEMPDWEDLRSAGQAIKERTLRHLGNHLLALEASVTAAGGQVHWAQDGVEANRVIGDIL